MAIREVLAKLTTVEEQKSLIDLFSSTPKKTLNVKIILVENFEDKAVFSLDSVALGTECPLWGTLELSDGTRWRITSIMKMFGSPNYDLRCDADRVL